MERLVAALVERLRPAGFSAVLCLHRAGPWAREIRARGCDVYGLEDDSDGRRRRGRVAALVRRVRRLRSIIEFERVDIVHTHYLGALLHAFLGQRGRRWAWVHTEHARPDLAGYPRWMRVGGERLLAAPDRVTAVSELVGEYLRRCLGRRASRVTVIANGVDAPRMVEACDAVRARGGLGLAADAWVVGVVANLRPEKRHDLVLRAFARVAGDVPEARLVLVGEGECRRALERLAEELGVTHLVSFLGMRADVPELLAAFDVQCLASRYEGMPLALLEGMAAGVPIVASAVPGIQEIVRDGASGLLFDPARSGALEHALLRLRRDPGLGVRLADVARAEVTIRFRLADTAERHARLYRAVVPGPVTLDPAAALR
jgi:glycosyltransferase involved in cell wall biosynthesis